MNTIRVSKDGTAMFKTIGEAIEAAWESGKLSRILVSEGVYEERVRLNFPVQVAADGPRDKVVITATGEHVVSITSSNVILRGFSIRGYLGDRDPNPPVMAFEALSDICAFKVDSGTPMIEDCEIWSDNPYNTTIRGEGSSPVFRRCRFIGKGQISFLTNTAGVVEESDLSSGPLCLWKSAPEIRDCMIHDVYQGVICFESQGIIERCHVFNIDDIAISLLNSETIVKHSHIRDSNRGIVTNDIDLVENCTLSGIREYDEELDIDPANLPS